MRKTILIVDDMEVNRKLLSKLFMNEYQIMEADNGQDAIRLINENREEIAVVLLDIIMPKVDGFGVLDAMGEADLLSTIPVVLITGDASTESKHKGYDIGVSDIIQKPFDSYLVKKRVNNLVDLYDHKNRLEGLLDEQIAEVRAQNKKLNEMYARIIDTLGTIVEFRNLESGMHILRVREFTKILLKYLVKFYPEYQMSAARQELIGRASALHDVGKIAIPDTILLKPAKLTEEEFRIMKCHTTKGSDIIEQVFAEDDSEYLTCCREIARSHHEKYDGKGYPDGLKGDEIPIAAQVVSIADVYDALISERVYKRAYTKSEAYDMNLHGECGVFNPKLIECFKMAILDMERKADELVDA